MISLLQKYLQIPTVYPNTNYDAVTKLFKEEALRDGFTVNEIILPSGNPVLVITLHGTDNTLALALNHHMDVVPAENIDEWTFPPFSATINDGRLCARGAQDCKSLGIVHYGALKRYKELHSNPARTIHLIIVPDEERGGDAGTREFIELSSFASLNIGYLLDEGMPSGDRSSLLIKIDERTPIQIRLTSTGSQGHASGLHHDNSAHELIKLLAKIVSFQQSQQEHTATTQPGALASIHITSLTTNNSALNVIPSQACATIDMRIPSTMMYDEGIAWIETCIADYPTITYEVLETSIERYQAVSTNLQFYQSLARAIEIYGMHAQPYIFEASTDARFYSQLGIPSIGFTPFSCKPNLHGTDESVLLTDIEQGIAIFYNFFTIFCTTITH